MKTLVYKLVKFSILLFLLYCGLIIIFFNTDTSILNKNINYRIGSYGHLYSRLKEVKQTKNIDILFLGASHTYRGFDPRIFKAKGYNCFNLGSSSQTPLQTEVLLNRYLDQLNPKIIVFDVYPLIFSIDGVEAASDLISNDNNDIHTIKMAFIQNQITVYNTLIYAFSRQLLQVHDTLKENTQKKDDTYISGGFVESKLKYNSIQQTNPKPSSFEFRNDQLSAFNRIIKSIKKKNIKLLLVQAPTSKKVFHKITNMQYCDSLLKSYGEYLNYNYLVNLNDSLHFSDPDHLNQNGVEIFNAALISKLNL
jgi:poly-D-alanine transfer protein DltD